MTALQAAWSAIHWTRDAEGPDHVEAALQAAIAIGNDTDTVAAIAGALLGARYGVSGLPTDLARRVHGWPGLRGRDLVRLALATAGEPEDRFGLTSMLTGRERPLGVPHPDDPGVLLGTEADLARCAELGVTAVVSLSRVGVLDLAAAGVGPGRHAEVWLLDSDDPRENADLSWTLADAARTVASLRDAGERVLLHCVAAEHRTPSVALAYSRLRARRRGRPGGSRPRSGMGSPGCCGRPPGHSRRGVEEARRWVRHSGRDGRD
ncbi:ADP-ribosylglycohydrolase family protein [Propioniciclava coleopterorum]|uniref:ADP-ribosylglycohydrolase family protein n=1 Tax=Propioniciclava coleopterorum TaxID=2714937 RepID=UPI00202ACF70|nr:ADP-ribosylglycohydrolase family protein [Propioniciclava coleopterorum]